MKLRSCAGSHALQIYHVLHTSLKRWKAFSVYRLQLPENFTGDVYGFFQPRPTSLVAFLCDLNQPWGPVPVRHGARRVPLALGTGRALIGGRSRSFPASAPENRITPETL